MLNKILKMFYTVFYFTLETFSIFFFNSDLATACVLTHLVHLRYTLSRLIILSNVSCKIWVLNTSLALNAFTMFRDTG